MTRREILQCAVALPLPLRLGSGGEPQIISEPGCLSQESAEAFRALNPPARLTILCAVANIDTRRALALREQIRRGRWVLWEISPLTNQTQRAALREVFGIRVGEALTPSTSHLYLEYSWPRAALTRTFSALLPLAATATPIAHHRGRPAAVRRGRLIVLGSLLGPNVYAGEPQAGELITAIFSRITSDGTSTKASTNT